MLVKPRNERGSTLISVLMVMLVLTIIAMALAAVVMNTTRIMADSRTTAQSRAAADAGLAAVLAAFNANGSNCPTSAVKSTTDPKYTTTCAATSTQVTFTSTGTAGTASDQIQAVYELVSTETGGAALTFFNQTTLRFDSNATLLSGSSDPLRIELPAGGGFWCLTKLAGDVAMAGSFKSDNASCGVTGDIWAEGRGLSPSAFAVDLSIGDTKVGGAVVSGAGVSLGRISKSLTLPSNGKLEELGWKEVPNGTTTHTSVGGGIAWVKDVPKPKFRDWFEYQHPVSGWEVKWKGYDPVKITNSTSPFNCSNINGKFATFLSPYLRDLTKPTAIDLTSCSSGLNTGSGQNASFSLQTDVVLIANKFTLEALTIKATPGKDPKLFLVVPDTNKSDLAPTCSGGAGDITTTSSVNLTVKTMAYTPCKIKIGKGGVWTGAWYTGHYQGGGGTTIVATPMLLPDQPGGSGGGGSSKYLGALVSQREVTP